MSESHSTTLFFWGLMNIKHKTALITGLCGMLFFLLAGCLQPVSTEIVITDSTNLPPASSPTTSPAQRLETSQPITPSPKNSPTLQNSPTLTSTKTAEPAAATAQQPESAASAGIPAEETIPLAEDDAFRLELKAKKYLLTSAGSIRWSEKFIFSAYVFIQTDSSPLLAGDLDVNQDTVLIAFYRWDGSENQLIGVKRLSGPPPGLPVGAEIINWTKPASRVPVVEFFFQPGPDHLRLLNGQNYSSDINRNALPEFAFLVEYCPISCNDPMFGIQLFELQSTSSIVNLTEDLPGLTRFTPFTENPSAFSVTDTIWYDFYSTIQTTWVFTWDGAKFNDISASFPEAYTAEAELIINSVQSYFGQPFEQNGMALELATLKILKLYEKAGMPEQGLEIFMQLTDPAHWPGTGTNSLCWLNISRATAEDDFKQDRVYSIPGSSASFESITALQDAVTHLEKTGHDMRICKELLP